MHSIEIDKKNNTVSKRFTAAHTSEKHKNRYFNEIKCLQSLYEQFINKPVISHYPFPKILAVDKKNYFIKMTYCGRPL